MQTALSGEHLEQFGVVQASHAVLAPLIKNPGLHSVQRVLLSAHNKHPLMVQDPRPTSKKKESLGVLQLATFSSEHSAQPAAQAVGVTPVAGAVFTLLKNPTAGVVH